MLLNLCPVCIRGLTWIYHIFIKKHEILLFFFKFELEIS